jgi:amidase
MRPSSDLESSLLCTQRIQDGLPVTDHSPHAEFASMTLSDFNRLMESREMTSLQLTEMHLERIAAVDASGPHLRAVIELDPAALDTARRLDAERRRGRVRSSLHGIPILIKDNIDIRGSMLTTAGSLALTGAPASADAPLVRRLRAAGVVIVGKANLSEWANFRSTRPCSGWSARGGQTRNPHVLDRSPSGSSSGSAVAVAAGLVPVAVGTETDGSIVNPSSQSGVVGFKPAVGRVSSVGIIPVAASQDTAGAHGRHVADVVGLYSQMSGRMQNAINLNRGALKSKRLGVLRGSFVGYSEHADRVFEQALVGLRSAGATLVDPVEIPSADELRSSGVERTILLHEFKAGLNSYLRSRPGIAVTSLAELIDFNRTYASKEMPYFCQELLELAEATTGLNDKSYLEALAIGRRLARHDGIDQAIEKHRLDALVAPTSPPACVMDPIGGDRRLGGSAQLPAVAGYPHITVPAGFALDQLPVGLSLFTLPSKEADLLAMAYAFEQTTQARRPPEYRPTLYAP